MTNPNIQNKLRGSLIGGAIGDALGYPVEFVRSFEEIEFKYGEGGVRSYDKSYPWLDETFQHKQALFSDDTQMTLYTAEGLLYAVEHNLPILPTICNAYLYWLGLQISRDKIKGNYPSKLVGITELNQRRAPGHTCISAMLSIYQGEDPFNDSKGCGGIMRIAPVALFGATHNWTLGQTAKLAGDVAQITHIHQMSTLASACAAAIIHLCITEEDCDTEEGFTKIVERSLQCVEELYVQSPYLKSFRELITKAIKFKDHPMEDHNIIESILGGGWVAEETLAIALFSVIRYLDSFEDCIVCAVNHGGDSDSTAAVAGNIIGAILGLDMIPRRFTTPLQLYDLLKDTADDLCKE